MKKLKNFLKKLGPGFITGAADDDPSGMITYAQTGAKFGYNQLWTSLFSFPFMTVIQEICGRIGMVTGKGLASIIRHHYSKKVLFFSVILLFIANTINVGADLGAMAASGRLLFDIPFGVWLLIITIFSVVLQIYVPYPTYAKFLKYLTISLFAYVIVAFMVKQPWDQIFLKTFIPSFSWSKEYLFNIVAILGTTISPYLFFWETDQEAEEDFTQHRVRSYGKGIPKVTKKDIKDMRMDTFIGMFFSQLIMFFIIITTASTLHLNGITNIETADQAILALRPLAGEFAYILFAFAIIGTGLLAVPILAGSAGYALSEALGWKAGLNYKFKQAHSFYLVIAISTLIGALINFIGIPPFKMLYYTAIFNGVISPPLMVMLMLISSNKKILGEYTNGRFSNIAGWIITIVMSITALALLVSLF
ncbi:MAG: divalent metal cation transporter [Candidatus Pacebacteria bacterium]|nr:divalent metal cation transporter [Candidatus Paceibacterota bacterium]MCF7862726.1 divalent metal cation transporter [Candidatus Paceibacterota bacterium]